LGFVVENYREDYSEKQNAKELLSSMLTDLQEDIIRFETFSDARKKLINDVYSFIDDVENRGLLKDDLIQQKLFSMTIFNWTYFEPNTANIEQVISSGALRYLGNDELIHQIGVLESQNLSTMNRQKREQEFFLNYLQPLMHKHYNFKWINSNFVRNWESFYHANEKLAKVNPSSKDLMFWVDNTELKKTIINLFENYVFILRASYGANYDEYLHEINDTIQIIELHLETE
tara:strand:- start:743 stop:1435 length:693 start_codon:yes stop_codon:yes gene_type:complete